MRATFRPTNRAFQVRYLLVWWLFILSAVAYLDRTNLSIAGMQIAKDFAIDNQHLGWIISAFLIGYAAFQVPAGLLTHRFGSRLVLTFAVLWWGVFSVLTALVPPAMSSSLLILMSVRFSLGAGEATMYPASSQFVERWFPREERGKANGIIFGGVGVGSGITPPLVTAIIVHYGWRASFWASALIGAAVGMVWYLLARDAPEKHPLVRALELSRILDGRNTAKDREKSAQPKHPVPWAKLCLNRDMLAVTASDFAFGYVAWVFFGWFYIYLAEARGLNLKSSALYSMLPFVGMTTGCLLGGVLSDWLARRFNPRFGRCILPAICMIGTGTLLTMGARTAQASAAALILSCGVGLLYIAQSCFWVFTADFAGEFAGVASGMMNMGGQIGGACTASLTPLIASHFGWEASFLFAALLSVCGGTAWLLVNPHRNLSHIASSAEYAGDRKGHT